MRVLTWTGGSAGHYRGTLALPCNLQFQQNVAATRLAVVVLVARSTRLIHTLPLMENVLAALGTIKPGDVVSVG